MNKKRRSSGISLLEILVSMMILALVMVGLLNVFVASRSYMSHGRFRTSASQLATVFLEPLQTEVNQSSWDTVSNNLRERSWNGTPVNISGVSYTPNYTITNESAGTFLRRVKINITWNETR